MSANGSEHWLIHAITLLRLCITAALLLHPGWLTVILSLLVTAIGAGQSLLRCGSWMLADHITTTRQGIDHCVVCTGHRPDRIQLAQPWSWVGPSCIGVALSLVLYSFATDVYWLERRVC